MKSIRSFVISGLLFSAAAYLASGQPTILPACEKFFQTCLNNCAGNATCQANCNKTLACCRNPRQC